MRRFGGTGVHTRPEPYSGPRWFIVKVSSRGTMRTFRVSRLNRSPTGSGHGAFMIEEMVSRETRSIVRGYNCSLPTAEDCLRVSRKGESS